MMQEGFWGEFVIPDKVGADAVLADRACTIGEAIEKKAVPQRVLSFSQLGGLTR